MFYEKRVFPGELLKFTKASAAPYYQVICQAATACPIERFQISDFLPQRLHLTYLNKYSNLVRPHFPFSTLPSILPAEHTQAQYVHDHGYGVDKSDGEKLGLHCFPGDDENNGAEKVKISEKEDKPDTFKAAFPEGVFPDQMSPEIEETLYQDRKG